jgi:hypothetical protein
MKLEFFDLKLTAFSREAHHRHRRLSSSMLPRQLSIFSSVPNSPSDLDPNLSSGSNETRHLSTACVALGRVEIGKDFAEVLKP